MPMITATIGRMFLEAYNEKYGSDYNAQTFFVEKFYPLFFNHNKYMMTAGNSPLENPKLKWDDMIKDPKKCETPEQRKIRFNKLIEKIKEGKADASIARGFPSLDITATTSGQLTSIQFPLTTEDIYLSWIGDGLGVGVQGGFSILFCKKEILLDIFEGWKYYRTMLNETPSLKGNQINTWNGQWLSHFYDDLIFSEENPLQGFDPLEKSKNKDGIINIKIQPWIKIIYGIAKKYNGIQLIGNVYSIGQTNSTIGFIPFELGQITKPMHIYRKLFGLNKKCAEPIWENQYGFKTACSFGSIGLKAIEPKGLKPYIMGNNPSIPKRPNNEEQIITYHTYETWLLAMLNNNDLWDKSQLLAQMLFEASTDKSKSLSTKSKNLVEDALRAYNKKQFVTAITAVIHLIDNKPALNDIVKDIHEMPNDNVPYFLTLVRFQYAMLNNNN